MTEARPSGNVVRFGVFEANLSASELRKNGVKIKLQQQPFELLALLLERRGQILSHEELRKKLWPEDTFVDFGHSLGTAINKIRQTLGDSADSPRFVETIPRRGYRFIAPVEAIPAASSMLDTPRSSAEAAPWNWKRVAVPAGVALAASLLTVIAISWFKDTISPPGEPLPRRFSFPVADLQFSHTGYASVAISPNGRHIAYVAGHGIWIRDLKSEQPRRLDGTGGAGSLFWSPGSEFLGFATDGAVKRVAAGGGSVITLCELADIKARSNGSWNRDGNIFFDARARLYRVAERGGAPELIDDARLETAACWPYVLPILNPPALICTTGMYYGDMVIWNLRTGERRVLHKGLHPRFSPSGHLVFQASLMAGGIWALPFSTRELELAGESFPVDLKGRSPSVSQDGTLVYAENPADQDQLVLLNRDGDEISTVGQPQRYIAYPAFSPDGRRVAVWGFEPESGYDIWVHEVGRPIKSRLTTHDGMDLLPTWSPAGDRIAFSSDRSGRRDLYAISADRGEPAELLFGDPSRGQWVTDWSRDGRHLLFFTRLTAEDLWYLEHKDQGGYEAKPLLQTRFREEAPAFSPDGRYVAFSSDRSGRFEIYVCSFPKCQDIRKVSTNGGYQVRWSKKRGHLYYVEGNAMMEVPISTQPDLSVGIPRKLFTSSSLYVPGSTKVLFYDVSPDGERFVAVQRTWLKASDKSPAIIRVVQNWFAEFP